jgi:glutamyl endopeptidase
MNHPPTPTRWRRQLVVGAVTGALAIAGGTLPASPAQAASLASGPHAAVADGGTLRLAPVPAGLHGVSSVPGTGLSGAGELDDVTRPSSGTPVGGAAGPDDVLGDDNRTRVNPTTVFPVNAIVQIVRNDGTNTWGCTGWLYGPSIVATAGHCVHPGNGRNGGGGGGFYPREDFEIIAGRNFPSRPYGTCRATQLMSVNGWTGDGSANYDYGAVRLDCTVGNSTGWWGFWWQSASLTGASTTVSGYPCDKTFGEQWRHAGGAAVQLPLNSRRLYYNNDTFGCQSGSPVYQNRSSGSSFCVGWCVMAIHAYGGSLNSGTRIVEPVFNNLIAWRG